MRRTCRTLLAVAGVLLFSCSAPADVVDDALSGGIGNGTLSESEAALVEALKTREDDRVRFALGLVQALGAFEALSQDAYRHGTGEPMRMAGMFVAPELTMVIGRTDPEPISYAQLRRYAESFVERMAKAERTLSQIDGDFRLEVDVLAIRLDFNGDGVAGERETLGEMIAVTQAQLRGDLENGFVIVFDRGDADWLHGYCNLTMAFGEWALAHDWSELFDTAGHLFFPKNESTMEFLKVPTGPTKRSGAPVEIVDVIAFIHLLRSPVIEPARMEKARLHLVETTRLSRSMWEHYLRETDDEREWIPNSDQTPPFPGAEMTQETVESWIAFMGDVEQVLEGRKLLPFWRGDGTMGVNARRAFRESREFDLVLWIQGAAATPYLEEGDILEPDTWERLEEAIGRSTSGYILWLN